MWDQLLKWGAQEALAALKAEAAPLEQFLNPYIADGEGAIQAAAAKFNPILGSVVAAAIADLGPDVPKFEGDAVAWLEAVLTAWIAKL